MTAQDFATLFVTVMTAGPGSVVALLAVAGILVTALALSLASVRHADVTATRFASIATQERAGRGRVLRQRDPDAAGRTRSRAPSPA
ncbi:hypothetical protein BC739_001993 [Kutzneria viridogrisea]|uniref:Uncharacterized protein n=3 Tax=Pseudonocardiaceae TaxID=2070 RepID=W5W9K8_9PSEU|nr:hypothetical protein KALB_4255 [Kutzneria albida DSM 43870]MBA8924796.1 hypothetical protein [Kutzneria viridogrisea]